MSPVAALFAGGLTNRFLAQILARVVSEVES
jgi:hypothetical protein